MANNNFNAPAFPFEYNDEQFGRMNTIGLTKREYFAAMAMQGYLAGYGLTECANAEHVAKIAVECADALLTELEK